MKKKNIKKVKKVRLINSEIIVLNNGRGKNFILNPFTTC